MKIHILDRYLNYFIFHKTSDNIILMIGDSTSFRIGTSIVLTNNIEDTKIRLPKLMGFTKIDYLSLNDR